ncbi:MAG TPA: hypothetical protein VF181_00625 [Balneolaceae bacterium]
MMQNDNQHSRDWRPGRIIVFSLLALIGLLLLIQVLLTFVAEPLLKNKIASALAGNSQDLTARVEDVDLSLLNRQIRLENLVLFQKDSLHSSPQNQPFLIDSLSVPLAVAGGIQILPFLFSDALKVNSVSISQPFLEAVKTSSSSKSKNKKVKKSLYQRINSFVDVLEIDEFLIEGFSTIITDSLTSKDQIASLGNFYLHFSDIRIDSTSPQKTWLPSSTFKGSADSLQWKPSGMYQFKVEHLRFSSTDSLFDVRNFIVNPLYPEYVFSQKIGHEATRVDLKTDSIAFHLLDLPALIEKQKLLASHISIDNSKLEVFFSKILPSGEIHKMIFPHVRFRRLDVPVKVDSVIISNTDITYIEQSNLAPQPGTVTFENTSAVIRNLNNTADQKAITMNTSTEIMGVGLMNAAFRFPANQSGRHSINAYVGPMEMEVLNPALKYLALVQITSGKIDSINFRMELGPQKSDGILKMDYSNLHIEMIDIGKQGKKSDDDIKTLLANLFAVDEKDKPPLREADISYERVLHKSIFNYWWKSLLSGLKNCIGL